MTSTASKDAGRRDRRRLRHEATKQEIADVAWTMIRADGPNSLSLRALASAVDMEPQSLYTYFASKHAVYDRLFADANAELLRRVEEIEVHQEAKELLSAVAHVFLQFAAQDPARYELLFLRTIPRFEPSPDAYAGAVLVFEKVRSILCAAGLDDEGDFDLWTALVSGLASQQLANEPGGDRYVSLVDNAVAMFAAHVFG